MVILLSAKTEFNLSASVYCFYLSNTELDIEESVKESDFGL